MDARTVRRRFLVGCPVVCASSGQSWSGLLALIVGLGIVIGLIEGWSLQDSIYFSFVSGLTIGYGDLVPRRVLTRALAILIGMSGVVATAVVAAIAVRALSAVSDDDTE